MSGLLKRIKRLFRRPSNEGGKINTSVDAAAANEAARFTQASVKRMQWIGAGPPVNWPHSSSAAVGGYEPGERRGVSPYLGDTDAKLAELVARRRAMPVADRLITWQRDTGNWPLGSAFRELGETIEQLGRELKGKNGTTVRWDGGGDV